ncbi:MAG: apolipoprotein N-acyltransferase [Candidatus Hinthialibacter sp.]
MKKFPWMWKKTIVFLKPNLVRSEVFSALATGILLVLVYPPFNLTPLLAIALIPLFLAIQNGRPRQNAAMGFLAGFIFYLGLLQWLHHVTSAGMLALVVYLSILFSAKCVMIGWSKRFTCWIPISALIWVGVEYLRSWGSLSFAWGYLGHGLDPVDSLKQITYWIGVPGLSFFAAGFNASLAEEAKLVYERLWKKETRTTPQSRTAAAHAALAFFLVAFVFIHLYGQAVIHSMQHRESAESTINVALIQGAFDQDRKESASEEETLRVYLDQSERSLEEKPDLIVWPESTITMPLEYYAKGTARIQQFVDENNVEMLIGAVSGRYTAERKWRFQNNAFLFSPGVQFDLTREPVDLSPLPVYSKIHLVPFGEWIPFGQYWPFYYIETLIEEAGAGIFQPGETITIFDTRDGVRFAVTICFESTLPRLWRRAKNQGADFMINLTNDAWYRRSAGLQQHFSQCCFRAAENRLYVARAANTGISGLISPSGDAQSTLPLYEPAYGVFSIPLSKDSP